MSSQYWAKLKPLFYNPFSEISGRAQAHVFLTDRLLMPVTSMRNYQLSDMFYSRCTGNFCFGLQSTAQRPRLPSLVVATETGYWETRGLLRCDDNWKWTWNIVNWRGSLWRFFSSWLFVTCMASLVSASQEGFLDILEEVGMLRLGQCVSKGQSSTSSRTGILMTGHNSKAQ